MTTTLQAPIASGFGASSTALEVVAGIDLSGKTAIVTGGASGIGVETTRALRTAGARVIVPARDTARASKALASIEGVEVEPMDLADPASIDSFSRRFVEAGSPLHVLVNSAGIMATPLERDARGIESQLATNHVGHFQLTLGLWPALTEAHGARVVAVSSWGHRYSPFVFEDPQFERRDYDRWSAYGQSKTANILFALALDVRGKEHGVRAFSLHPGTIIATSLSKHLSADELHATGVIDASGAPILDPARNLKTPEQGAATSVWCATSPRLHGMGGLYCENCDVAPLLDTSDDATTNAAQRKTGSGTRGVLPYAVDPASAERLWRWTEALLGPEVERSR